MSFLVLFDFVRWRVTQRSLLLQNYVGCIVVFEHDETYIAYDVCVISYYVGAPFATDLHVVMCILNYWHGILSYHLWLCLRALLLVSVVYSDVDWTRFNNSCMSTVGYAVFFIAIIFLGTWISNDCFQPFYWSWISGKICKFLDGLCIHFLVPIKVYCDNVKVSYMDVNLVQHDRSKHITIDRHFICEQGAQSDLVVWYTLAMLQLDIFVNELYSRFDFFEDNMSIRPFEQIKET